jgi:uncharacterized protein (TIGR02646 family)
MIFVDRTKRPIPHILDSPQAESARARIALLLGNASKSLLKQLRFSFEERIWISTRPALTELFHDKCAYCESTSPGASFLHDIDHFRPKQGAEDLSGNSEHLYYAWLAYDWDNLLIACPACNRMRSSNQVNLGKGQRFPVTGARAPLLSTVAQCRDVERGTLLDPCCDQPSEHLTFNKDGE